MVSVLVSLRLWHEVLIDKCTALRSCRFHHTSWQWFSSSLQLKQRKSKKPEKSVEVKMFSLVMFNFMLNLESKSYLPMAEGHHRPSQEGANLLCPERVGT